MHFALLEDDPGQLALVSLRLEAGGHSCTAWETLADFQAGLPSARYDGVLLNWMLSDGSSQAALQWARETLGWHTAILVLGSDDDPVNVEQALQAGADDFVITPAKQHELVARLESAVRRAGPIGVKEHLPAALELLSAELGAPLQRSLEEPIAPTDFRARLSKLKTVKDSVRAQIDSLDPPKR